MRIIARINLWYNNSDSSSSNSSELSASSSGCDVFSAKVKMFDFSFRAPMLWAPKPPCFSQHISQLCKEKDWQLRLNVANSAHKRTTKRLRFNSREIWRLSNRLISIHVNNRERGSKSPFYFYSLALLCPSQFFFYFFSHRQLQCIKST